jgi:hypothetical protein
LSKDDLEQIIGRQCDGYRACYGSANDDTFSILQELGFRWSSNPTGRHRPEFFSNWRGSWPYPHHPHEKSKLIVGNLRIYEIPMTTGLTVMYDQNLNQPLDLRVETPPAILGEQREKLRQVIEENIVEMQLRRVPLCAIIGGSHNTSRFNDRSTHQAQNLDWVDRHARQLAEIHDLNFEPASFADMLAEAERTGSH